MVQNVFQSHPLQDWGSTIHTLSWPICDVFPDGTNSRQAGVFGAGGGVRTRKPPAVDMSLGGSNLLTANSMRRDFRNGILSIRFPLKREGGKLNTDQELKSNGPSKALLKADNRSKSFILRTHLFLLLVRPGKGWIRGKEETSGKALTSGINPRAGWWRVETGLPGLHEGQTEGEPGRRQ